MEKEGEREREKEEYMGREERSEEKMRNTGSGGDQVWAVRSDPCHQTCLAPCVLHFILSLVSDQTSGTTRVADAPSALLPLPQATCLCLAVSDGKENTRLLASPACWVAILIPIYVCQMSRGK